MLSNWRNCCTGFSQRWIFAIMAFIGLSLGNGLRVALSITITEMVTPTKETKRHMDGTCFSLENFESENNTFQISEMRYDWDEYTQGIILSSYFWGYAATQFLFGSLSERFGGKYFMGFGILIPAILTFFTPFMVEWGEAKALIGLRVVMGMSSGAIYPAASTMISQWTTLSERTRFGSVIYAGAIVGTVFGTTMPALIIEYSGWPAVFHLFGAAGVIWFPAWTLLCYSSPVVHPYISDTEFKYLQETLERQKSKKLPSAPWRYILASKPFWMFVIALVGCDWAYFTMANDLPKYMSSIVRFSIKNNGYLSSLPYVCMWLNTLFSSWLVDLIIKRNWISLTNARKILTSVSLMGPGVFLLGASYAECDQVMVVIMFIVGMTLMGSSYPSLMVNALDLSPNYAGTLMAIGNGIAALGGVLTPYVVGILTPNQTIGEWRLVFWIVFGVAVVTNACFVTFASADVQFWDDPEFLRKEKKTEIPIEKALDGKLKDVETAEA